MKNTRNKKQIHFLMHKNFTFLMHQGGIQNTIKWNKYRSQLTKQAKTNNLYYSIDPTFNKVNRLFVLPFENENRRASFWTYYASKVEIKDFIVFVDGKSFLIFQ